MTGLEGAIVCLATSVMMAAAILTFFRVIDKQRFDSQQSKLDGFGEKLDRRCLSFEESFKDHRLQLVELGSNTDIESEIQIRFRHHAPDAGQIKRMDTIRTQCRKMATHLIENVPRSPELDKALDAIELVSMHANAAIARRETKKRYWKDPVFEALEMLETIKMNFDKIEFRQCGTPSRNPDFKPIGPATISFPRKPSEQSKASKPVGPRTMVTETDAFS